MSSLVPDGGGELGGLTVGGGRGQTACGGRGRGGLRPGGQRQRAGVHVLYGLAELREELFIYYVISVKGRPLIT